jgi:hypothetical protein
MSRLKSVHGIAMAALLVGALSPAAPAASADPSHEPEWRVLVNRQNQKQVLDDEGSDGKVAITYPRHNGKNQQWDFDPVGGSNYVLIHPKSHPSACLTGGTQGAKVWIETCGNEPEINKQWRVKDVESGWFQLVNRSTSRCLEYTKDNTRVQTDSCDDSYDEQWRRVKPS